VACFYSGNKKIADRVADMDKETFYLVGGYNDVGPLDDVYRYESAEASGDMWTKLLCSPKYKKKPRSAYPPLPRIDFDACCIDDTIYIFGGIQYEDEQVLILNDLWALDVTSLSWTLVAEETPLKERAGHVVVVAFDSGSFIVHGGEQLGQPFEDTWLYNTLTGAWTAVATTNSPRPCPRSAHSATSSSGSNSLVIFGGVTVDVSSAQISDPIYLNDLWVLSMPLDVSPTEWTWHLVSLTNLAPSPRDLCAMISVSSNKILIFGGFGLKEMDSSSSPEDVEEREDEEEDEEEEEEEEEEDDVNERERGEEEGIEGDEKQEREDPTILAKMDECSSSTGEGIEDVAKRVQSMAIDDDCGVENEDVQVEYLNDVWLLDLSSQSSTEINLVESDIQTTGARAIESTSNNSFLGPPRRGCKMVMLRSQCLITFGGFDGETFYGSTPQSPRKPFLTHSISLN